MPMEKRGIALSFVLLAFSTAAAAQTTVTLMQGQNTYAGTTDDWIICCTGADLNKGTDNTLGVRGTSDEALIRFAIFAAEGGPVPNGATITSATLSLYKYDGPDAVIQASRVLKSWSESTATWNSTGTVAWTTPGATGAGTDILATPDGQGSIGDAAASGCGAAPFPDVCWINIDVTAGVQAFAGGTSQNFGWLLTQVSSSAPAQYKNFNSRDNPNFPALRPKLTVTWSGGGGPVPPTAQLTATPASGPAPLAVQFSASQSADNGSPITSLTLQFGDGQQITWADKTVAQSHTYAANGTYTASLTATNAAGTSAPATQTISVGSTSTCIPSTLPLSGVAVPTFHNMSLYDNPPAAPGNGTVFVRYRVGSADPGAAGFTWNRGQDIWYDTRGLNTYAARGSVVELQPNTPYVFELGTGASYDTATWQHAIAGQGGEACPSTWSETFPIATTLAPPTNVLTTSSYGGTRAGSIRSHALLANQSGTPNGYTAYDYTGTGAVAQAPNTSNNFPVVISGSYIILKGLKTVGGESGIFIDPGSHDIVIDGVEVTGYGRDSGTPLGSNLTGNEAVNEDAGIKFPDSSYGPILQTRRIVIQHSKIHNPAFGANPWDSGHPSGTTAIMMYPTGGQIVIRYNASYSTTTGLFDGPPDKSHFHEDGLVMGGCNDNSPPCDTMGTGIGPDVDIYKNLVMDYFDDGLETDGDGLNNRVWKNYFDYGGASAVSTTPTLVGPAYVWRNVYNRARLFLLQNDSTTPPTPEPWGGETDRLYMFKSGGVSGLNGGRRYLYHNTSLQPPFSSETDGVGPNSLGAGFGAGGNGGVNAMQNTVSRNNVFEMWRASCCVFDLTNASGNDLDFDLSNGNMGASPFEPNGIADTVPQYQAGNGWSAYWNGRYRLVPGTPGYDTGVRLPNFNDGFVGAGPDRGAHEDGTPDMDFGPGASGD